jgi:predicted nucleotidyltransferase
MKSHIYSIDEIKTMVKPIAHTYGLDRMSLFGSYARGDAKADSDIDILIYEKHPLMSLFKLSGLHLALENRFGMRVDVLVEDSLDAKFLSNIKDEEVVIYEG